MKAIIKFVLIAIVSLAFTCCGNHVRHETTNNQPKQVIEETNQSEFSSEEEAAKRVAYQFVMGTVNENYVELMTLECFFQLMPDLFGEGILIDQLFSTEYTHTIHYSRYAISGKIGI